MMRPTLSIIIPVYNKEKYITRCISSVLEQTYTDFEMIVIDDGSTDCSGALVRGMARTDKRVIYRQFENGGVAVARNRGLDLAQGTYVMFIDSDDWIAEGYLQNIMDKVASRSADLYIWGITKDRENGAKQVWLPFMYGYYDVTDFLRNFIKEQYESHRGLYGYISNKLLRREILTKRNIRFKETLKLLEDYDFFLSYYGYCKDVMLFDEIGYHYVAGTNFSSGKMVKKVNFISIIDIHRKCRDLLKSRSILTEENDTLLLKALRGLSFASFWKMKPICIKGVNKLLSELLLREEVVEALKQAEKGKERFMAQLILRKNTWGLYFFVGIFRLYLRIRTL